MAEGFLVLNRNTIENPSGCYNSEVQPMWVDNQTDTDVTVYDSGDCSGDITGRVEPGDQGTFEFGASVSVP